MTENSIVKRKVSQPSLLTLLRIVTGMVLIYKSVNFIRDSAIAKTYIQQMGIKAFAQNSDVLASLVAYLGLLLGLFIVIGLFTRVSAIILVPVLLVAVFFVNIKHIGDNVFEFILSMLVLLLLLLFAVKGSGPFSADEYFRRGAVIDENARRLIKK